MPVTAPDRFDVVFAALSDPTRRSIVRRLADGEASVLELGEPFPLSLPAPPPPPHAPPPARSAAAPAASAAGGLAPPGRAGRGPEPLVEIAAWAEHTRAAWDQRLD